MGNLRSVAQALIHVAGDSPVTITSDPNVGGRQYQVTALPTLVVIDTNGVVRQVEIGAGGTLDRIEATFVPLLPR